MMKKQTGDFMKKIAIIAAAAGLLLCACGEKAESSQEMQYIKTSVLYDTLMEMYADPDSYLGQQFHMVGELYPTKDGDETFYSIYGRPATNGEGIGLELEWSDFSGLNDYDTITVEGTLEERKDEHEGQERKYLVLKVSSLEKRES